MSDDTQEMHEMFFSAGWGLLLRQVMHFDMSVTDALASMREHNQNMAFLSDANAEDMLNRLTLLYLQKKQRT